MQVVIRTPHEAPSVLYLPPAATVGELKERMQLRLGIPKQRTSVFLMPNGKMLRSDDSTPLVDYGAHDNSEFKVCLPTSSRWGYSNNSTRHECDRDGTCFMEAAKTGDVAAIWECLLSHRIHVDFRFRDKRTALMTAARRGHGDSVEFLFHWGADLDARDQLGETALFHAVHKNSLESVKALLQCGAKVSQRNVAGLHVLDICTEPSINKLICTEIEYRNLLPATLHNVFGATGPNAGALLKPIIDIIAHFLNFEGKEGERWTK